MEKTRRWTESRASSPKSYARKMAAGHEFQEAYDAYASGGSAKNVFDQACTRFVEHIVQEMNLQDDVREEAVQVGMATLLEALRDYEQKSYVQTAATFARQRIRELLGRPEEEGPMARVPLKEKIACDEVDFGSSVSQEMLSRRIAKVLKTLSYREREIIKLRYGLGDGHSWTLEEVGHIFKVTRDRIRMIEAKALRKLQQPSRTQELVGFLP